VVRSADKRTASDEVRVRQEALTQAQRTEAIRAGWNDAAWGRPHRAVLGPLAHFYEVGYSGGLVFRDRIRLDQMQLD